MCNVESNKCLAVTFVRHCNTPPSVMNIFDLFMSFKYVNITHHQHQPNPWLIQAIQNCYLLGHYEPFVLLIGAGEYQLQVLKASWARSQLKSPFGFAIESVDFTPFSTPVDHTTTHHFRPTTNQSPAAPTTPRSNQPPPPSSNQQLTDHLYRLICRRASISGKSCSLASILASMGNGGGNRPDNSFKPPLDAIRMAIGSLMTNEIIYFDGFGYSPLTPEKRAVARWLEGVPETVNEVTLPSVPAPSPHQPIVLTVEEEAVAGSQVASSLSQAPPTCDDFESASCYNQQNVPVRQYDSAPVQPIVGQHRPLILDRKRQTSVPNRRIDYEPPDLYHHRAVPIVTDQKLIRNSHSSTLVQWLVKRFRRLRSTLKSRSRRGKLNYTDEDDAYTFDHYQPGHHARQISLPVTATSRPSKVVLPSSRHRQPKYPTLPSGHQLISDTPPIGLRRCLSLGENGNAHNGLSQNADLTTSRTTSRDTFLCGSSGPSARLLLCRPPILHRSMFISINDNYFAPDHYHKPDQAGSRLSLFVTGGNQHSPRPDNNRRGDDKPIMLASCFGGQEGERGRILRSLASLPEGPVVDHASSSSTAVNRLGGRDSGFVGSEETQSPANAGNPTLSRSSLLIPHLSPHDRRCSRQQQQPIESTLAPDAPLVETTNCPQVLNS